MPQLDFYQIENVDIGRVGSGEAETTYENGVLTLSDQNGSVTLSQILAVIGCLEEHTLITMADGTQKEIREIKKGDEVLGYDFAAQKTVATPVVINIQEKTERKYRCNIFSDGTVLNTVGEHFVYEVDGDPCRDVNDLQTSSKVMKQDGTVVTFNDYTMKTAECVESYNLYTANNTYFANGVMNSCFPPAKFANLAERHIKMPKALRDAVDQEIDYSREGARRMDNPDYLRALVKLGKKPHEKSEEIKSFQDRLEKNDYKILKICESMFVAAVKNDNYADFRKALLDKELTKFKAVVDERIGIREEQKAARAEKEAYNEKVRALRKQYGIITEFEEKTLVEQFSVCNHIGNQNAEKYRAWLKGEEK